MLEWNVQSNVVFGTHFSKNVGQEHFIVEWQQPTRTHTVYDSPIWRLSKIIMIIGSSWGNFFRNNNIIIVSKTANIKPIPSQHKSHANGCWACLGRSIDGRSCPGHLVYVSNSHSWRIFIAKFIVHFMLSVSNSFLKPFSIFRRNELCDMERWVEREKDERLRYKHRDMERQRKRKREFGALCCHFSCCTCTDNCIYNSLNLQFKIGRE